MSADLLATIRRSLIGGDRAVDGPFGRKPLVYADYTASGRPLTFIEDFLREHVLPAYANTHTETSATGRQTTAYREDARAIIHRSVGANENDVVIFCGTGATGAITKVARALNLALPPDLDSRYSLRKHIPEVERPVVFIGPYEHHSNDLPWRESIADVVVIDEDRNGLIDLEHLAWELEHYRARPLKIGSFSAASNVTGICSDTRVVAALLHRHGALSFWDYAAAGPYARIEMNPPPAEDEVGSAHKDAVFISPHKFVGGPGTPGVLVVKKHVLTNRVPTAPGGGTVGWVSPEGRRYLWDETHREEGGTPDIIGSIRAGLAFQLKDAVGADTIAEREHTFIRRAIDSWSRNPNIRVLGDTDAQRLSIVSFVVQHGERSLHHNFVVALLNDLFGIQARGGCSCAGPYGHRLLGIDNETSARFVRVMEGGCALIKPGWARLGFNYFISDEEVDYIIRAVHLIADHGYTLLPRYRCNASRDDWRHDAPGDPGEVTHLTDLCYRHGELVTPTPTAGAAPSFASALAQAERELAEAGRSLPEQQPEAVPLPQDARALRWFWLPDDIPAMARGERSSDAPPEFLRRVGAGGQRHGSSRIADRAQRRVLVLRHEDWKTFFLRAASRRNKHCNLGAFETVLRRERVHYDFAEAAGDMDVPMSPEAYSHVIVLGGRMGAHDDGGHDLLRAELELLEAFLARDRAVLGICLGAQLLARVLGADVRPGERGRELGWHPIELTEAGTHDPLLGLFPPRSDVFQWHDDTFDVPDGCVHLASSERYAAQAFRYGARAWGVQFHLEITPAIIERWIRDDHDVPDRDSLFTATGRLLPGYREVAESLLLRFLAS